MLVSEPVVLTISSIEILKMVNVKLFGRKKATRSMKGTQDEDKKELTGSKNIIEDSDEELARLND